MANPRISIFTTLSLSASMIATAIGCSSLMTSSQTPATAHDNDSSLESRDPASSQPTMDVRPKFGLNKMTPWSGPCSNSGGEKIDLKGAVSERCDRVVQTSRGPKTVHVVTLRGTPEQTAYAHGYLMAKELEDGILKTATDITTANTSNIALRGLYRCYANRMRRSVSNEFIRTVHAMWDGYQTRLYSGSMAPNKGKTPKYSKEQALEAIIGIEVANVAEGLAKRVMENPAVAGEIIALCALQAPANVVRDAIEEAGQNAPKLGGCIGFSVPPHLSDGGKLIHARNLDIDMVDGWNKHPTLFLVDQPGKAKYVASAAAGMVVPGGIGGMNEHGLAISLHQMSTTKYVSETEGRTGIIAPALSQKILEEARTIEEATEIINKGKNFASWTIFISEAKTGRVSAIEFSGERVRTVYTAQNEAKGQTNHFLHPEMQDQAFTYNYNKHFESTSRLNFIEEELATLTPQRPANLGWTMSRLAAHTESLPDRNPGAAKDFKVNRAFGRTPVKAYNVMSVIMIPEKNQYWSTIAERNPAAHSTWVGYTIDWQKMQAKPLGTSRVRDFDQFPNWDKSLEKYVEARQAYQSYIGNNPALARQLLTEAIELAKKDGIDELPYYFIRARVTQEMAMEKKGDERAKLIREALVDWNHLWNNRDRLYMYGQALVAAYSTAAEDEIDPAFAAWDQYTPQDHYYFKRSPERQAKIQIAYDYLEQLSSRYSHFDLDAKRSLVKKLLRPQRDLALPSIDFVVIEQ